MTLDVRGGPVAMAEHSRRNDWWHMAEHVCSNRMAYHVWRHVSQAGAGRMIEQRSALPHGGRAEEPGVRSPISLNFQVQ